jgi:hypothetical protein
VVNGARDGLGERVFGPLAAFDGGDGRGDYVGPFGVGVAGCWGHCLVGCGVVSCWRGKEGVRVSKVGISFFRTVRGMGRRKV